DIVDTETKLELFLDLKAGCNVEVVLRAELRVRWADGTGQIELRIQRGELHAACVSPTKRYRHRKWRSPSCSRRMPPARLHIAGIAKKTSAIVRRRKAAIVDNPVEYVT